MKIRILLLFLCLTNLAQARSRIEINHGIIEPIPLALNHFDSNSDDAKSIAIAITNIIEQNFKKSGLIKILGQNNLIEKISFKSEINYQALRQINAPFLVVGNISTNEGNIFISIKLYDNFSEKLIATNSYNMPKKKWRELSHIISDDLYIKLTGEDKYFNSKIAFIAESGSAIKKIKKLAIMDQDGANIKYITNGKDLVLTPRFSPSAEEIIYLSYQNRAPRVYLYDIRTNKTKLVGEFPGMSFAPRFSPNGQDIAMAVANKGHTDIYKLNLKTNIKTRLTQGPFIDTSPNFSYDGKQIIFASDRSGKSQLYIMNNNGTNQERISFGEGSYHTPAWSPRSDLIAFTKILDGKFHIGVMKPDGSGERILTEGYMVEGPSWSPNGRVIIFTKGEANTTSRMGKSKLHKIDITGFFEASVDISGEASDPHWSKLLQ